MASAKESQISRENKSKHEAKSEEDAGDAVKEKTNESPQTSQRNDPPSKQTPPRS